jgi:hypothetical protein
MKMHLLKGNAPVADRESSTIGGMSTPTIQSNVPADALATGDAFATSGRWLAAVDAWAAAVRADPTTSAAAERRLEWLLRETSSRDGGVGRILPLLLAFAAATLLAMSFLAFAGTPGSRSANLWAIATWVMIAIAAVSAVVAARESGEASLDQRFARARRVAARLDRPDIQGSINDRR